MDSYRVKLTFKYSDVVYVKSENAKDAERKALEECQDHEDDDPLF